MQALHRTMRGAALAGLIALGACSGNTGGLGNILGSVLGGQGAGAGSQVSGTIDGVDTRNQQIGLRQSNGRTVGISFDNNTRVVYQNQNYNVTSLERGDQVTVRVQQNGNSYYTDLVQVDQSVRGGSGSGTAAGNGQVQSVQGTVRQLDVNNGLFVLDGSDRNQYTVYIGNTVSRADFARFQNLRNGEPVRFYGVFISNTRVELRQFY